MSSAGAWSITSAELRPEEVAGSAMSSLYSPMSSGCLKMQRNRLSTALQEGKKPVQHGAGDTRQTLDSVCPFSDAPNPVFSPPRG